MKINDKGLTLVEVISVVVIVSIMFFIITMAFVTIHSRMQKTSAVFEANSRYSYAKNKMEYLMRNASYDTYSYEGNIKNVPYHVSPSSSVYFQTVDYSVMVGTTPSRYILNKFWQDTNGNLLYSKWIAGTYASTPNYRYSGDPEFSEILLSGVSDLDYDATGSKISTRVEYSKVVDKWNNIVMHSSATFESATVRR